MTQNILENFLAHSKKTKSIIGIRKHNDDLYVGYIVDYNETYIIMQHISKTGMEDGLLIEQISSIESFETDDDYVKSYQMLFLDKTKIGKQTIKNVKLPKGADWQYELLMSLFGKGKIISIELKGADDVIHGFILGFDETYLRLKPIGSTGTDEGESIYHLGDIDAITVDRIESRKRETFYKLKNKN